MRKAAFLGQVAVLLALLAGCGGGADEITQLPRALTASENKLIQAEGAMGLDLLKQLAAAKPQDRNLFISPLSIAMSLGMTYNGAANTTAAAMRQTLALAGLTNQEIQRGLSQPAGAARQAGRSRPAQRGQLDSGTGQAFR